MKVKPNLIQSRWLWFKMHGTYMNESSSTAEYHQQQQQCDHITQYHIYYENEAYTQMNAIHLSADARSHS